MADTWLTWRQGVHEHALEVGSHDGVGGRLAVAEQRRFGSEEPDGPLDVDLEEILAGDGSADELRGTKHGGKKGKSGEKCEHD